MNRDSLPSDPQILQDVDPLSVSTELLRQGWRQAGEKPGVYSRWTLPDSDKMGRPNTLVLPLDPVRGDFVELMRDALDVLSRVAARPQADLLKTLGKVSGEIGDELRWRRESAVEAGRIAWPAGRQMYHAAELSLLSAAKARLSRSAYYGNKNGRFAHRFLESCMMGQTDVGSYIVTAFAPVRKTFGEHDPSISTARTANQPLFTGREITELLIVALQSTQEAVEHYERSSSLSGFDDAVKQGVSKEMAEAAFTLVSQRNDAELTVLWSPAQGPAVGIPESATGETTLEFSGAMADTLERAVHHLGTLSDVEYVTVVGWVKVVSRPRRGEDGVVRLQVLRGSDAGTLRVELTPTQFDLATKAIAADRALRLTGRQERLRTSYWLTQVSSIEEIDARAERAATEAPN